MIKDKKEYTRESRTNETIKAYQRVMDNVYCTLYRSFDGKRETLYDKNTHEITYRKANGKEKYQANKQNW